ncbi:AfsR/SARP family transcriptional regulator [Micromonospora rosaria]|uniref:AfsR/SARP family transcriptional regulator n=1 Tax=Micromonospora rosaria TaxID=47874 RepID=UPI0014720E5A|nr:BTAD domain-containing putative transcriptional regulator [Micromonospora rosaria]
MQICVLGPLEVRVAGVPVEVGGARLRRLLILLALEPGRPVPIPRLVDGVWGDDPPTGAVNALQALVSRLRRAVPGLPVEARPGGYRLALGRDAVDLHRFETAVAAGRALLRTDPDEAYRRLTEALDLWRGPALADVADTDVARAPVARLQELRLTATEEAVEVRLARGETDTLLPRLRELVAEHPLRERLTGQVIRALHRSGRIPEALAEYDRLRTRLAEQLGTDPSPELAALHLALLRGDPAPPAGPTATAPGPAGPPPAPTPAPTGPMATATPSGPPAAPVPAASVAADGGRRGNLPAGLTSFVGRREALDAVADLLGRARLVTLTGPGGAGKTRLAVEAGRRGGDRFTDGVWLVELASVTDPAEVAPTVLAALGLRETTLFTPRAALATSEVTDPTERLTDALATRAVLLVLDNCEHLLDATAALVDRLLAACPRLRVLATSREPLAITGETVRPVGPLDLPPPGVDPGRALDYPAVRLLVDRATAARPDFVVDAQTVDAVVHICRALDGMPLAIELAAARLRSMTVGQVAARLADRFRLFTAGSRTALPRHQTLRAVVDWSWDLLDPAERALWRRMAVFVGGATLGSLERVCAGGDLDPADVLDRLTALVEKSLVVTVLDPAPTTRGTEPVGAGGGGEAEPRYRMLETIREYGLARLAEAGEAESLRQRHAAEFLALVERADDHLRGRDQLPWLHRLRTEHDNVHTALRRTISAGQTGTAVRFVAGLGWYWWLRGHRAEGADLAEEVLTRAERERLTPTAATVVAYATGASNLLSARADLDQSQRWLHRGAEVSVGLDSSAPMFRLTPPMAVAAEPGREAAGTARLAGFFADADPWVAGVARLMHAHLCLNQGAPTTEAVDGFRAALELFESVGDRWGASAARFSLAELWARAGDHAGAVDTVRWAMAQARELGAFEDLPGMRARIAHQHWLLGDRETALALLGEARQEAERLGATESWAAVAATYGEVLRDRADWAAARDWLERARDRLTGRQVVPQWLAMFATGLAHSAVGAGDPAEARTHLAEGLALAVDARDAPVTAIVLVGYADLALRTGSAVGAAYLLGAAVGVRGGVDRSALDELRVTRAARDALGEVAFAEASARGRDVRVETAREAVRVTLDA